MKSQTAVLSPYWSRIIHRLAAIGEVHTSYSNSVGTYTQLGQYPRHIISSREDHSRSIDGSTYWNYLNWLQGWIDKKPIQNGYENIIRFSARSQRVFHQLRLQELQPNECLQCLIQLFSTIQQPEHQVSSSPPIRDRRPQHALSHILELALSSANKTRGVDLTLITEGGHLQKKLHCNRISENDGAFAMHCKNRSTFKIHNVAHLHSERKGKLLQTTLYNANCSPQAILQLSA